MATVVAIPAGATTATVLVQVHDDPVVEPSGTLQRPEAANGAALGDDVASGRIDDDDRQDDRHEPNETPETVTYLGKVSPYGEPSATARVRDRDLDHVAAWTVRLGPTTLQTVRLWSAEVPLPATAR